MTYLGKGSDTNSTPTSQGKDGQHYAMFNLNCVDQSAIWILLLCVGNTNTGNLPKHKKCCI